MNSKGTAAQPCIVDSSIELAEVGPIRVAKIAASQRDVSLELKPADMPQRYLNVVLQLAGSSTYMQHRRSAHLTSGQWAVFDAGRLHIVSGCAATKQLVLLIPSEQLECEIDLRRIACRCLQGAEGLSRLLCHTASCIIEELPRMSSARANLLGQTLSGLVLLAIQERLGAEAAGNTVRHGLRERIQRYVDENLRDPSLSIERIARQLDCSKRYLHKVFQGSGESLSGHILRQRLDRCRQDLSNPTLASVSITDIALSWGFNSASHFSRAFHARFGVSPRVARAASVGLERGLPSETADDDEAWKS